MGAAALVAAGCSSSATTSHPVLHVSPSTSAYFQPLAMTATGLAPGEAVTATLTSEDGSGSKWQASARFHADAHGDLNLNSARSSGGSYRGVLPMGLMIELNQGRYSGYYRYELKKSARFTLTLRAADGATVSTMFERTVSAPGVRHRDLKLHSVGFFGQYWTPAKLTGRHPAVLAFGGSEGGVGVGAGYANAFAAEGYPTLAIAYFGEPGLPSGLSRIPIEYFAKAARWLARQPGVDSSRIWVVTASYGTEAAQLLAIHYPRLVYGLVLGTPSDAATQGLTHVAAGSGAAWTYRGKAVPTSDRGDFWPPKAAAVFPDYRIRGPIFVVCGGHDSEWPSCPFSRAIVSQLRDHHFRYPYRLLAFPAAGHWVNGLVPNYLGWVQGDGSAKPDADGRAYADLWPKLLAFMATTSRP